MQRYGHTKKDTQKKLLQHSSQNNQKLCALVVLIFFGSQEKKLPPFFTYITLSFWSLHQCRNLLCTTWCIRWEVFCCNNEKNGLSTTIVFLSSRWSTEYIRTNYLSAFLSNNLKSEYVWQQNTCKNVSTIQTNMNTIAKNA